MSAALPMLLKQSFCIIFYHNLPLYASKYKVILNTKIILSFPKENFCSLIHNTFREVDELVKGQMFIYRYYYRIICAYCYLNLFDL